MALDPLLKVFPNIPSGLRTRFAPSPTGYLHLGHVASAIYVWGLARKNAAEIILRIEDHDQGRARKTYEASILDDLKWLGFHPDRGVESSARVSHFRQSDHLHRYQDAAESLGSAVYNCECSRKDILNRTRRVSEELWYDGACRTLNRGLSLRLIGRPGPEHFVDGILGPQVQCPAQQCGDLLLRDRDGFWTYNFAVALDDLVDDISLIIRGQDILSATGRQLQLREQLRPSASGQIIFCHHPLIWASEGKKLSKRDQSTSIGEWRSQGLSAADIIGKAAYQVGIIAEDLPLTAREAETLFHE